MSKKSNKKKNNKKQKGVRNIDYAFKKLMAGEFRELDRQALMLTGFKCRQDDYLEDTMKGFRNILAAMPYEQSNYISFMNEINKIENDYKKYLVRIDELIKPEVESIVQDITDGLAKHSILMLGADIFRSYDNKIIINYQIAK